MQRLLCKNPNLFLYTHEDILFVYSTVSQQLYGFKGFEAALFFYIEEHRQKDVIYEFVKESGLKITQEYERLMENMLNLLNATEELESLKTQNDITFNKTFASDERGETHYYKLYDSCFSLNLCNKNISSSILEIFEHLRCAPPLNEEILNVDILKEDKVFEIYVNKQKIKELSEEKHIPPVLQDALRIHYYQKCDFLIAMHAASLSLNDKVLIMPGVSGSGKSTLSSYLMASGFTLFSDELTLILSDFHLTPLPLCVTLKEGSWESVKKFAPQIDGFESYLRFDGQKIKFLPPIKIAKKSILAKESYFIFPKYKAISETILQEIDLIETIRLIVQAQYHLVDFKDAQAMESWLQFLSTCKTYTLIYSDLDDVKKLIQGLMR